MTPDDRAPPPFVRRLFLMPFSVQLWRGAAQLPVSKTLLPLLTLALLSGGLLGLVRGVGFHRFLTASAKGYDARFDAIVYENGTVRVDGDRLPRWEDAQNAFLVDPEETIAADDLGKPNLLVVRADRVLVRRQLQPDQELPLRDLEQFIGTGPTRIDSAWLAHQAGAWGVVSALGVAALMMVVAPILDGITCALYALLAGALLAGLRDVSFGTAFRVALAASSSTIVAGLLLHLAKVPIPCGCIVKPVAWTGIITGLAVIALRESLEDGPGPEVPPAEPA